MLTTSYPRFRGDTAGLFVHHLARTLTNLGHGVEVVAPWAPGSAAHETMEGVSIHRFRYSPWNRLNLAYGGGGIPENLRDNVALISALPLFTISFAAKAAAVAKRCDLIHAHWIYSGLVAGLLRRAVGTPAILTLRGTDMKFVGGSPMLAPLARLSFGLVDRVTAVSIPLETSAREMGCREDRIETIYNGVDLSHFVPLPVEQARKKLKLPMNGKIILFVGNLTENKGLRPLLEAFKTVHRKRPDALLVLVGEGALLKELQEWTLRNELGSCIIFAGGQSQDRLPLWYGSADLFVLPSYSEGRPNVLLEAMACGTPITASDIPGIREMDPGGGAFGLFEPGDRAGIAEAIAGALHGDLKTDAGPELRRRVIGTGLSWESCAEKYVRCYRETMGRRFNRRRYESAS